MTFYTNRADIITLAFNQVNEYLSQVSGLIFNICPRYLVYVELGRKHKQSCFIAKNNETIYQFQKHVILFSFFLKINTDLFLQWNLTVQKVHLNKKFAWDPSKIQILLENHILEKCKHLIPDEIVPALSTENPKIMRHV